MIENGSQLYEFVEMLAPGIMFSDNMMNMEENKKEFSFIIKEDNMYLRNISKYPQIELIAGAFNLNDIMVIVFLVKFHDNDDVLYECFLNIHSESNKETLEILSEQEFINIIMFDENIEIKRTIRLKNNIKERMRNLNEMAKGYIPWSMEQFDEAKDIVLKNNPDAFRFWDFLSKQS